MRCATAQARRSAWSTLPRWSSRGQDAWAVERFVDVANSDTDPTICMPSATDDVACPVPSLCAFENRNFRIAASGECSQAMRQAPVALWTIRFPSRNSAIATSADCVRPQSTDLSASTEGRQDGPPLARRTRRGCRPTRRARRRLALAALSALFVAVVVPTSSVGAQRDDSAAVIDAYESARNRGDMDTVVALFADDAVVVDSQGTTHRGSQQIRLLLRPGVNPDWAAEVTDCTIDGDYIFWTERVGVHGTARSLSVAAIVRGGSIKALAYGGRESLLSDASSAVAAPVLPAPYGLAGVLFAILSSLGVIIVSTSHPGHTALRGSMLAHLRQWSERRLRRRHARQP